MTRLHRFLPYAQLAIKLFLLGLFLYGTNHGLLERIRKIGLQPGLVVFAAIWLTAVLAIAAVAFHPKRRVRWPWTALLVAGSMFSLSFQLITAKSLSFNDFERLIGLIEFSDAVFGFYGQFLLIAGIWSLLGAVAMNIPPFADLSAHGRALRPLRHVVLLQILPIVTISLILYGRGGHGDRGLPVQYTPLAYATILGVEKLTEPPVPERKAVALNSNGQSTIRNVIVIMDESVRGDFLDINAPSEVRSNLKLAGDALVNFGIASSHCNCSAETNVSLRYGVGKEHYLRDLKVNPSIWDYAKKAGYATTYIDGQRHHGNLHNFMDQRELARIDQFIQLDAAIQPHQRDPDVARRLRQVLAGPGRNFVYINKSGCHFPYEGKYPDANRQFTPTTLPAYSGGHDPTVPMSLWKNDPQERLRFVNSYRNCVAWNTGEFFDVLLRDLDLKDTVIAYTSDHGQDFHEDRSSGNGTHCTTGPTVGSEGMVPLAFITRDPDMQKQLRKAVQLNHERASQFNIFPTLLLFMGYRAEDIASAGTFEPSLMGLLPNNNQRFLSTYFVRFGQEPVWNPIRPERSARIVGLKANH